MTPKYKFGSQINNWWSDNKDKVADTSMGALDTLSYTQPWIAGITGKDPSSMLGYEYKTNAGQSFDKASNTAAQVAGMAGKVALPMAANAIAPGSGALVAPAIGMAQQGFENQRGPSETYLNSYMKCGGQVRRKYATGGPVEGEDDRVEIEVEGNELEVDNEGNIVNDFSKMPSHEDGGVTYKAKLGNHIIPTKDRKTALEIDKKGRKSMIATLSNKQKEMEAEEEGFFNAVEYNPDGGIFIKPNQRKSFSEAAKRRGMNPQEFAEKVLSHREAYADSVMKQTQKFKPGGNIGGRYGYDIEGTSIYGLTPTIQDMNGLPEGAFNPAANYNDDQWGNIQMYKNPRLLDKSNAYTITGNPLSAINPGQVPMTNIPRTAPQNRTVQATTVSPYTPNPPKSTSSSNYEQLGKDVVPYIAPAMEIANSFSKKQYVDEAVNPYAKQSLDNLSKMRIDMQPIYNAIREEGDITKANARSVGTSAGQYLTNSAAISNNMMTAKADAQMKGQQANNAYDTSYNQAALQQGNMDAGYKLQYNMGKVQTDANARNIQGQGFTNYADIYQKQQADKGAAEMNDKTIDAMTKMYSFFQSNPEAYKAFMNFNQGK